MKTIRFIIIIFALMVLAGCNTEKENEDKKEEFEYRLTENDSIYVEEPSFIHSYQNYVNFLRLNKKASFNKEYDADYFETSSLILFGFVESSSSIQFAVNDVKLNGETLTISMNRYVPEKMTMDIAYHGYVIEYKATDVLITDVTILETTVTDR